MNRKTSLLLTAIINDDAPKVRSLLKPGLFGSRIDVNQPACLGNTILMTAAEKGSAEIVKLLLDAGADVNARGSSYGTALGVAVEKGHCEVVRTLLDAGAAGAHTLTLALEYGQQKVAMLMLERGCDVNHRNSRGLTALMLAVSGSNMALVKLLVEAGAEINLPEITNSLSGSRASSEFQAEIIGYCLMSGADVNAVAGPAYRDPRAKRPTRPTALMAAVDLHNLEIIRLLVESGADVNARDDEGETILFYLARWCGDIAILEYLFQHGLDVNVVNNSGNHPRVSIPSSHNLCAFAKTLFDHGAKYIPGDSHSLLLAAVDHDDCELLEHLLTRGADTEWWEEGRWNEDEWGRVSTHERFSLLTYSKDKGSARIVQILERFGSKRT